MQDNLAFLTIAVLLVSLFGLVVKLIFRKGPSAFRWLAIVIVCFPVAGIASSGKQLGEPDLFLGGLFGLLALFLWRKGKVVPKTTHQGEVDTVEVRPTVAPSELRNDSPTLPIDAGSKKIEPPTIYPEEKPRINSAIEIRGFPSIPREIAELVWFSDGPLKNYDASDVGRTIDVGYGTAVHMYMTSDIEPSAVSIKSPIKHPHDPLFVESPPYYPRYDQLTSEQRWVYLNWLTNIDAPIDLGYVFLYYYGLERHLFLGRYEDAFNVILRLRKHHSFSSFPAYSSDAMIASILFHNRIDMYTLFARSLSETQKAFVSDLHLYVKYLLKIPFSPDEIILLSSSVGFTNRRYIKSEYNVFREALSQKLLSIYGTYDMPWWDVDIKDCPICKASIVANTSLSPQSISIPKLCEHKELHRMILELLKDAHETTKERLKNLRKETRVSKA